MRRHDAPGDGRAPGDTVRVSVEGPGNLDGNPADGDNANGVSVDAAISADGRFVAFVSDADDLVAGPAPGLGEVFVRNLTTGTTSPVSVAAPTLGGLLPNGDSGSPAISADGRYVAFESDATNLVDATGNGVPDDTNGNRDVFVRDLVLNTTTRVSVGPNGAEATDDSRNASLSADGLTVAFESDAPEIVGDVDLNGIPDDQNGTADVFVSAWTAGVPASDPELASAERPGDLDNDGDPSANAASRLPSLSGDGRFLAFQSLGSDVAPLGDPLPPPGIERVYVRDLALDQTVHASVSAAGLGTIEADGASTRPALSRDGGTVVFSSQANTFSTDDDNAVSNVFARRLAAPQTTLLVSRPASGAADDGSGFSSVSAGGRLVAFHSTASNFAPGEWPGTREVYVRDTATGQTALVSRSSGAAGAVALGRSERPRISADGRFVAFHSAAPNLVPGDANGTWDVFVRELIPDPPPGGGGGGGGGGAAQGGAEGGAPALEQAAAVERRGRLSISRRRVRLDGRGRALILMRCQANGPDCVGRLTLRSAGRVDRRRILALGSQRFSIRSGRSRRLSVPVSRRARALIRQRRELRVRAIVTGAILRRTLLTVGRRR